MISFVVFISAYFTVAACVHRLSSDAGQSRRLLAWVGLSLSVIVCCAILFPMPNLAMFTVPPVGICAVGGLWASKHKSTVGKLVVITVAVGLAVGFHLKFGRTAPKDSEAGLALSACQRNLGAVSTGLLKYRETSKDQNPETLEQLVPDFLEALPRCPSAESVTYRTDSKASESLVYCSGRHHGGLGLRQDYPRASGAKVDLGVPNRGISWYEFY